MTHIYIFDQKSNGSLFGIGSYIRHLIYCLKKSSYTVTVVSMRLNVKEISIQHIDEIRHIGIPKVNMSKFLTDEKHSQIYQESIAYILNPYITKSDNNIFHLNYEDNIYLARKLKKIFGCPILFTLHYTEWSFYFSGNRKKITNLITQKNAGPLLSEEDREIIDALHREQTFFHDYCDKIIAIANHSYFDLINLYKVQKNKIVLINNALKDQYKPTFIKQKKQLRTRLNIAEDEIILVFAGRLHEIKGIGLMLDAFKIALKQESKLRLYIAGNGFYDQWLPKTWTMNSKISFTGYLPRKELFKLFTVADIGIIPSLHEEFGLVAIEMMMHKLPIIVNNTTGLSEIVRNRKNGLIARKNSSYDLAMKILELAGNKSLRISIGNEARKTYLSKYNSPLYTEKMFQVYESLIPHSLS